MPYKNNEDQKAALRRHYQNHKDYYLNRNNNLKTKQRQWYKEFMSDKKCMYCSENEKACLDWHHTNPKNKKYEITNLVKGGYTLNTIMEEIEKCVCVCANCHRKIHAGVMVPPPRVERGFQDSKSRVLPLHQGE